MTDTPRDRYPLSKLLSLDIDNDLNLIERELIPMPASTFTKAVARMVANYREAMKEIDDYGVVLDETSRAYDYITGGMISKPNTRAEAVIRECDDYHSKLAREYHEEMLEILADDLEDVLERNGILVDGELGPFLAKMRAKA